MAPWNTLKRGSLLGLSRLTIVKQTFTVLSITITMSALLQSDHSMAIWMLDNSELEHRLWMMTGVVCFCLSLWIIDAMLLHWENIWQLLSVSHLDCLVLWWFQSCKTTAELIAPVTRLLKYKIRIFYPKSGGKSVAEVHRLLHSCFLGYPCAMLSESRPVPPSHRMGFLWDHWKAPWRIKGPGRGWMEVQW